MARLFRIQSLAEINARMGRDKDCPTSTPYKKFFQRMKHISSLPVSFSKYIGSVSMAKCRFWG